MKIVVRWTPTDYQKLNKIHYRNVFGSWIPRLFGIYLVISPTLRILKSYPIVNVFDVLFILIGFIFIFPDYTYGRLSSWWFFKKSRYLTVPIIYDFTDKGVKVESKYEKGFIEWDSYTKYVVNSDMLLLYRSPTLVSGIPRRSVSNESDWNELVETVRKKVKVIK